MIFKLDNKNKAAVGRGLSPFKCRDLQVAGSLKVVPPKVPKRSSPEGA